MRFACIHIPNFPVQAVWRNEPELCFRSVAITEGKSQLVVAANQTAYEAGVQLGMMGVQVAQLPAVQIRQRSRPQEEAAHAALLDLGFSFSPRVEDTAKESITLDLEGLERVLGSPRDIAHKVVGQASGLGLDVNIAVAATPDAAFLAARGITGITLIESDDASERLGPLPVSILAPTDELLETLSRWGIRTFKALASLPTAELSERLGQQGVRLQKLARGTWRRALIPVPPSLHFQEVMELEYAEKELDPLLFILGRLLGQLCARLAARGLAANELRLAFELALESTEDCNTSAQYERALRFPIPMPDPQLLLKLLQLNLSAHPPHAPVSKVVISAEPAKPRVLQGSLFAPISPDPEKLEITLARIRALIGEHNLGSPELLDTHRPSALGMVKFNALSIGEGNPKPPRNLTVATGTAPQVGRAKKHPLASMRIFRPPLPAKVETRGGFPVRVFLGGTQGDVISAAGPWRSSGDWWTEEGWDQDEWEVEIKRMPGIHLPPGAENKQAPIRESTLYRIYRDAATGHWFVRGSYD